MWSQHQNIFNQTEDFWLFDFGKGQRIGYLWSITNIII